jgi:hypothetical protein
MRRLFPLAFLVVLAACSTTKHARDPNVVQGTGTVLYQDIEGGFYGIVADDSAKYDPGTLPESVRKDGLRVRFTAVKTGGFTTRMWGTRVEIQDIEPLK